VPLAVPATPAVEGVVFGEAEREKKKKVTVPEARALWFRVILFVVKEEMVAGYWTKFGFALSWMQ
jgi:hypothetical protein